MWCIIAESEDEIQILKKKNCPEEGRQTPWLCDITDYFVALIWRHTYADYVLSSKLAMHFPLLAEVDRPSKTASRKESAL